MRTTTTRKEPDGRPTFAGRAAYVETTETVETMGRAEGVAWIVVALGGASALAGLGVGLATGGVPGLLGG